MISEQELRYRQVMRQRGEKPEKNHETVEEFMARGGRVMYVPKGRGSLEHTYKYGRQYKAGEDK